MASSEVEETLKRLMAHKGVTSVVIVNGEGIPIRTSPAAMEHMDAVQNAAEFGPLVTKVRSPHARAFARQHTAHAAPTHRPPLAAPPTTAGPPPLPNRLRATHEE